MKDYLRVLFSNMEKHENLKNLKNFTKEKRHCNKYNASPLGIKKQKRVRKKYNLIKVI